MASTKAIAAIALTLIIAVPIGLGYVLAFDEEETTNWETTEQYNVSDLLLNSSTQYYQTYTGPNNNEVVNAAYLSTGSTVTSTPIYSSTTKSMTLTGTYQEVPNDVRYTITTSLIPVEVRVTEGDGSVYEEIIAGSQYGVISKDLNKTVTIKKTSSGGGGGSVSFAAYLGDDTWEFTNIQKVELKYLTSGTRSISYTAWTATGTYADASAGWAPIESASWSNGFHNNSVTFSVDFTEVSGLRMVIPGIGAGNFVTLQLDYDGSNLSYGSSLGDLTNLGKYSKAQIVVAQDKFTINALKSWSSLGSAATTFNSATLEHAPILNLDAVTFDGVLTHVVAVRCDSAEIPAGSFPTTKDYTLSLSDLFPDSLMSLKLNSIGVYGDSLTVGGVELPVTDGKVHVDGKNVSLKGAVISFLPDEDGWLSCYINGRDLGMHFAALPSVTFGGEWSLTAIAFKVEQVAGTSVEWHAGDFGLDQGGIIAAGLLTCIGAFVFLGMYGKASGTKIGLLAVVCGGAAIVLFMLI